MSAPILLAGLRRRGFTLSLKGEAVTVDPASKLTEADRRALNANLSDLKALLWDPQATWEPVWPWYERFQDPDWWKKEKKTDACEDHP